MAKVCVLSTLYFLLIMNIEPYILTGNVKIVNHRISWVGSDPQGSSKLSSWKVFLSVAYSYVETYFLAGLLFWVDFYSGPKL